jgi:hypothetical protein
VPSTAGGESLFGHVARMAFIVWSTPHAGREDEFNRWYDEVHLPDSVANGSFTAMHRYEAVGPGYRAAPFLSIAEADYGNEAEAWGSVRPKANALHRARRIDDLYRVDFAQMLLTVDTDVHEHAVGTLTTVQNDWREPAGDAREWLASLAIPSASPRSMQLLTTDPAGERGGGRHLALFESATDPEVTAKAWADVGAAGSSPLPAYTTIFGVQGVQAEGQPPPEPAWVMHWRHLVTVGR